VNAQRILELQRDYGSFKNWLDKLQGFSKAERTKLFKKTFKFTGGKIVNEFLMSTGYLPDAHDKSCNIYRKLNAR
jgi:DNA-3-methyladenine glycosylase I